MASMKLKTYLKNLSQEQRIELAKKVGASERYLYRIGGGYDPLPSLTLATKIKNLSGGKVKLESEYPVLRGLA